MNGTFVTLLPESGELVGDHCAPKRFLQVSSPTAEAWSKEF